MKKFCRNGFRWAVDCKLQMRSKTKMATRNVALNLHTEELCKVPENSISSPSFHKNSALSSAVFTLEDEQVVWTDKSSQTNKSSDVKMGRTNFSVNKLSHIWPSGKTIFPRRFDHRDEQVDDSTTQIHIRQTNARRFVRPLVWKRPSSSRTHS